MPADKKNDDPIKKYIAYWDDTVKKWFACQNASDPYHGCESDSFLTTLSDYGKDGFSIQPRLMPEPYWGNPSGHSVVIANLNPGGGIPFEETPDGPHKTALLAFMDFVRKHGYFEFARTAPVFMESAALERKGNTATCKAWSKFPDYGGYGWWHNPVPQGGGRFPWAVELAGKYKGVDARKSFPFVMELCGWHSRKWNPGATAVVRRNDCFSDLVVAPFLAAVRRSKTGLGLCVGAAWRDLLKRPEFGFRRYSEPICLVPDKTERLHMLFEAGDDCRVLVTWQSKPERRFNAPVSKFWPEEIKFLNGERVLEWKEIGQRRVNKPCRMATPPRHDFVRSPESTNWSLFWNDFKKAVGTGGGLLCNPGANDGIRIIGQGAGWFVQFSPTGSDMKLEVHAKDRAGRESLKRRVSTLSETTLPGAWKKCRIGGRGSLAVASFKVNAFDKTRPDFASMVSAGKRLLAVLQGGR